MADLKRFERSVKEELSAFKSYYKDSLKSKIKILDVLSNYIHSRKKNDLLPLLTILSAKLTGAVNPDTFAAASIIDHLYTATQIHDDVEEETFSGNIFLKLNALWKEKLSVLMGDYFLAKGLILSVNNKTYDLLEVVSKSIKEFTEGELTIIHYHKNLTINSNDYLDVINLKSASIVSACTTSGAMSAGADKEAVQTMTSFGRNFGMALYIRNELDFSNSIKHAQYRMTLPFLLSLQNSPENEKTKLLKYLQYPVSKDLTKYFQHITEIKGGVENSRRIIEDYKIKALDDLTELPYSESLETVRQIVDFSLN